MPRPKAFTDEEYEKAVLKRLTLADKEIGRELKKPRMTVYRFRINPNNKELIERLTKHIVNLKDADLSPSLMFFDNFKNISIIQQYMSKLKTSEIGEHRFKGHIRNLYTVCKYLKVHPAKLDIETYCTLIIEMRDLQKEGGKPPRGMYFNNQRHTIRSFFGLMHDVSGQTLLGYGIHAHNTEGLGKDADKSVSPKIRIEFERLITTEIPDKEYALEILGACVFMYGTATRKTACFSMKLNDILKNKSLEHSFNKNVWRIQIIDKGTKGGKLWNKYLRGSLLIKFRSIIAERHNIPIDEIEDTITDRIDYVFPLLHKNPDKGAENIKKYLIKGGVKYKEFKPVHIWRSTFAQEFLRATNWNYEACASLGGWENTSVLKRSYGKMPEEVKVNMLARAMGEQIDETVYALDWRGEVVIEDNNDLLNILKGADRDTLLQAVAMIQGAN